MIWQANDLCYGVRRGMEAHLKAGRDVVVNGSREYVPQLMQLFPDAKIVWIEADTKLVMDRLIKSKSNSGAALLRRQERIDQFMAPAQHEIIRIDNSGPPHIAGSRLCEILFAPRA